MMFTLHKFLRVACHVIAQIVEAELVICSVSDVGVISGASLGGVRLMLIDAVNGQSEEVIQRAHPFRVTLCQIIVDGHDMHSAASEGVKINRQGGNEGLSLTGSHLRNLPLMKDDAAYNLHIVMHHVPSHHVSARHPAVAITHTVTINNDVVVFCRKLPVKRSSRRLHHLVLLEQTRSLFHHSKRLRLNLIQSLLNLVQHHLLMLVYLLIYKVLLVQIHVRITLDLSLQLSNLRLFLRNIILYVFLKLKSLMTKTINIQQLNLLISIKCLTQQRLQRLVVTCGFISK